MKGGGNTTLLMLDVGTRCSEFSASRCARFNPPPPVKHPSAQMEREAGRVTEPRWTYCSPVCRPSPEVGLVTAPTELHRLLIQVTPCIKRLSSEPQPTFTVASAEDGVVCSSGVLLRCNVMGGMV
jgi:hypothetical protein